MQSPSSGEGFPTPSAHGPAAAPRGGVGWSFQAASPSLQLVQDDCATAAPCVCVRPAFLMQMRAPRLPESTVMGAGFLFLRRAAVPLGWALISAARAAVTACILCRAGWHAVQPAACGSEQEVLMLQENVLERATAAAGCFFFPSTLQQCSAVLQFSGRGGQHTATARAAVRCCSISVLSPQERSPQLSPGAGGAHQAPLLLCPTAEWWGGGGAGGSL